MNNTIKLIFCFVTVSCASRQNSNRLNLTIESLKTPYKFESIEVFRVSDFDNSTHPMHMNQYKRLFQHLATDRNTNDDKHIIPALIHSKEFLLTKHQIDNQYDFITVMKEYEHGKKIYWLSYHSKDSVFDLYGDSMRFLKGQLTNHGTLSDEFENDSIKHRTYSRFIEKDKIIKTSITHYYKNSKTDSSITYMELLLHPFNDGFTGKGVGEQHYRNGILIHEMWDSEAEWTHMKNSIPNDNTTPQSPTK